MNTSNARSGEKRKSSTKRRKGKQKKIYARELSFFVDCATSAAEELAAKLTSIINSIENVVASCIENLLAIGCLQCHTPLYFYTCTLCMQKRYRDMPASMKDADEKFVWVEWQLIERGKLIH